MIYPILSPIMMDLIMTYVEMQNKVVDYVTWERRIQDKIASGEDYSLELEQFHMTVPQMQQKRENFLNQYTSFTK